MFTHGSLRRGDMHDIIYDAECSREGRYGCIRGPIWVQVRANMGLRKRAVMGLASRAVSAWVT